MIRAQTHATNCKLLQWFLRAGGAVRAGHNLTVPATCLWRHQQSGSRSCLGFLTRDVLSEIKLNSSELQAVCWEQDRTTPECPECTELQISARKHFLDEHSKEGNGVSEQPWGDWNDHPGCRGKAGFENLKEAKMCVNNDVEFDV